MAFPNCVRIARLAAFSLVCAIACFAADNAQLLAEFQKTKSDVAHVNVIAESPLVVATSGEKGWAKGEWLGVFAPRGGKLLQIAMSPNNDAAFDVKIEHQTEDSITLAMFGAYGHHVASLKVFYDPKTFFP